VPRPKRQSDYDQCPRCGESKLSRSNVCLKCMVKSTCLHFKSLRPEIVQPTDASISHVSLSREQVAIVNRDRQQWATQWDWYTGKNSKKLYATRHGHGDEPKRVYLHRQLMGEPDADVDHINGNTLDCRSENLRICTRRLNSTNRGLSRLNTSGVSGVTQEGNKWRARIRVGGKHINLGLFDRKEDAVAARVYAEFVYYGEFAYSARCLLVLPPALFS
jgi:hypothetical protein